jgi:hypothetical protein
LKAVMAGTEHRSGSHKPLPANAPATKGSVANIEAQRNPGRERGVGGRGSSRSKILLACANAGRLTRPLLNSRGSDPRHLPIRTATVKERTGHPDATRKAPSRRQEAPFLRCRDPPSPAGGSTPNACGS